jgi:hypothetical protein
MQQNIGFSGGGRSSLSTGKVWPRHACHGNSSDRVNFAATAGQSSRQPLPARRPFSQFAFLAKNARMIQSAIMRVQAPNQSRKRHHCRPMPIRDATVVACAK